MDTIKQGDKVKSFDFEGRKDCYVEGTVVGFEEMEGCQRYRIEVSKRVWKDKEIAVDDKIVFPPVNGTPMMFGDEEVTNFVEKVS